MAEEASWRDRVRLSASVGYEYDDNVTAPDVDASSEQGASSGVFEAGLELDAYAGDSLDATIGYDFFENIYAEDDVDELDLRLHQPWLTLSTERGDFGFDFTTRTSIADLGSDSYFQLHSLGPTAALFVGESLYLSVGYEYQYRDFERSHPLVASTNDRTAHRHTLRADAIWLVSSLDLRFNGGFVYRAEDATKIQLFDYDSIGGRLGTRWTLPVPGIGFGSPELQLRLSYDARRYTGESRIATGGGPRRDDRSHFSIAVELPLYRWVFGSLAYEHLASDSNFSPADYKSNVFRMQVMLRI